jgi:hypothetical protein
MDNTNTTNPNENERASALRNLLNNRRRMTKIALIVAAVLVIAGLLYTIKGLFVAAVVNGHPISRLTVVKELERQAGKDALDTLIDKQLINDEAAAKNITVSQDEIDAEMKKFEDQFNTPGQTLDDALAAENLTRDDLEKQIFIRKEIEKLLGDKANVTDEEVQAYITDNKITLQAGMEQETKDQIKDQLRQQKLAQLSTDLLKDLRAKAKIRTFVDYKGSSQPEE